MEKRKKKSSGRIKGVLFDMDGVLIDAKEWHFEALNRALSIFGLAISRLDHITTFDGLPTRTKLEMLTIERGLPRELHSFINEMKQQYTTEIVHVKCKPLFIHEYALAQLRANGYKIAVCSNSIRSTIELMMNRAGLARYLDATFSNQDVKEGKPHPEIYLKAMKHLNLQPDQCLVVEDNEKGVRAAVAAGAHVIEVASVHEVNFDNISAKLRQIEEN